MPFGTKSFGAEITEFTTEQGERMTEDRAAIFATFLPKPGNEQQVEAILRGMVAPTRREPGCIAYDLYRAQSCASFHLFETYRDKAAVEAYRATEHYKAYRATISNLLAESIGVVIMDCVDART